jgi:hypothetical protein
MCARLGAVASDFLAATFITGTGDSAALLNGFVWLLVGVRAMLVGVDVNVEIGRIIANVVTNPGLSGAVINMPGSWGLS